jgi:hypothetical protein
VGVCATSLLACVLALLVAPVHLAAQPGSTEGDVGLGDGTYLLVTGPERRIGLDFLEPNVLEYTYGRYVNESGTVHLYHLTNAAPSQTTGRFFCGVGVLGVAQTKLGTYARFDTREFTLLLQWDEGITEADLCTFLARFLRDFAFFRSVSAQYEVPLPAVIK